VITDEELERITLSIMEENADKKNKNIEEEKRK